MNQDSRNSMLAVVADPEFPGRFQLREVDVPMPRDNEAVVAVKAFSLNAGEVRDALSSATVTRPGWDLAGVVEKPAANGAGPAKGARVVGLSMRGGAWAQRVSVPADALAVLPDGVSHADASTLPVAGLTALYGLARAGALLGRDVLVKGASGGVGRFVCRLAALSGASVTAVVRSPDVETQLRADGVGEVIVGEPAQLKARGSRYALVFDTLGGASLAQSLTVLAKGGMCVVCGNSADQPTTFDARSFYHQGRVALMGLYLGAELDQRPACEGLSVLARLVDDGRLRPPIEAEASWSEIAEVAVRLTRREIRGKAVLHVEG
jgi:NADPH:quinone reductase-like Zn-dependent oxidoreductase